MNFENFFVNLTYILYFKLKINFKSCIFSITLYYINVYVYIIRVLEIELKFN